LKTCASNFKTICRKSTYKRNILLFLLSTLICNIFATEMYFNQLMELKSAAKAEYQIGDCII